MPHRTKKKRRGLSLVDLLVICGCVLVIVALTTPAVYSARSAAAQAQCNNNLKQIGLALHNYHATFRTFPPGWIAAHRLPNSGPRFGWQAMILPFVEQNDLYRLLDFQRPLPAARGVLQREIAVYRCPDDATPSVNALRGGYGTSNYSGNHGTVGGRFEGEPLTAWLAPRRTAHWPGQTPAVRFSNGIFGWNSTTRLRDILDGTSNTFMVGERSAKSGAGIWPGVGGNTLFYDAVTDCAAGNELNARFTSFSSEHGGGANFVFCDGHVKFISDKVTSKADKDPRNRGVYQKLSSRNDGALIPREF